MVSNHYAVVPGGAGKPSTIILIIITACLAWLLSSCGPTYVRTVPTAPVVVQPVAPYAGAVWVEPGWRYRRGTPVYINGYYTRPRAGRVYYPGEWRQTPRGYYYTRGRWR